jgi:hypothetical protein
MSDSPSPDEIAFYNQLRDACTTKQSLIDYVSDLQEEINDFIRLL